MQKLFPNFPKFFQRRLKDVGSQWGAAPAKIPLDELTAAFLRFYRRRLKKGAVSGVYAKVARVGRKRYARRKTREIAKRLRRGARVPLPRALLLSRYRPSPLLTGLYPDREANWRPVTKRRGKLGYQDLSLSNFSLIDYPAETLKAIKKLAAIECEAATAHLHFDDDHCIDIAPYLVLAEIWDDMAHVFHGGRMSMPVQKVVEAVGLRKPLGMRLELASDLSDVWAFPLRRRRPPRTSKSPDRDLAPQPREKVSDDFCDAIDEWLLEAAELGLTTSGKSQFSNIIGELLDNAERHSDPVSKDGSWSVAAFMARRREGGEEVFRCHMAFLSVGASIAESLDTAEKRTQDDIVAYATRHKRTGQSAATLATLIALQDGVTRDADASAHSRGGVGFQDVFEFVSGLGATTEPNREPRITIVSGSSCIQLRPPYLLGRRGDAFRPRVLWCNANNSPDEPPDRQFVFDLEDRFAGTVIGVSFVLDVEFLKAAVDVGDQAERTDGQR
ncbi:MULTISPECIES: hypothetical protein [unclassified Chelatococcus]|uniref:hypothetical protein n=1 Tax=unclassified Chelatococcus TaxID=2638111 RepID=UPI001BCF9A7F|nr:MULTISPECIES: hypothetical protein [unclassified Chelatococcus]MBS7698672.1 hypothetical protein [Chelatococcus sp. YT9]MBX3554746.1 hypothetical protein [Chelatococcus sp.]